MPRVTHTVLCCVFALAPWMVHADDSEWRVGVYAGKHYDSEPGGFFSGRANFQEQYLLALTAAKTVWRAQSWPVSIEIDAMLGQQWGTASLAEVAIAPALRINAIHWTDVVRADLRLAPLGLSYTSTVGPLERNAQGQGAQLLNYLFLELALSRPQSPSDELFLRLHHRCTVYDQLNNYGANGEDFFTLGWRRRF